MIAEKKLDSLQRCVTRVRRWCPDNAEALAADIDAQDILSLNLTRAVQLCVDIGTQLLTRASEVAPETMSHTFTLLAQWVSATLPYMNTMKSTGRSCTRLLPGI